MIIHSLPISLEGGQGLFIHCGIQHVTGKYNDWHLVIAVYVCVRVCVRMCVHACAHVCIAHMYGICSHVCMAHSPGPRGRCWESCSINLHYISFRQGLSLNLEISWCPVNRSVCWCSDCVTGLYDHALNQFYVAIWGELVPVLIRWGLLPSQLSMNISSMGESLSKNVFDGHL